MGREYRLQLFGTAPSPAALRSKPRNASVGPGAFPPLEVPGILPGVDTANIEFGLGRQRNLDRRAQQIQAALRSDMLTAPDPVAAAFAVATKATVGVLIELNRQIAELEATLADRFEQHPDAVIYLSMPGLGDVLGARALGEFGDDPNRYADAKSRKNYAGTSPITVASGNKKAVLARHVRNQRLYDAIDQWAFCSLTQNPGCRQFYDQRRNLGDLHHQALRALGNRLVGILHGYLKHHTLYNEHTAWAHRQPRNEQAA